MAKLTATPRSHWSNQQGEMEAALAELGERYECEVEAEGDLTAWLQKVGVPEGRAGQYAEALEEEEIDTVAALAAMEAQELRDCLQQDAGCKPGHVALVCACLGRGRETGLRAPAPAPPIASSGEFEQVQS